MHLQKISLTFLALLTTIVSTTLTPNLRVLFSEPWGLSQNAVRAQAQTTPDLRKEALRLFDTGKQQYRQGQFIKALETFQQVLVIFRAIGDTQNSAIISNDIGLVYHNLGQDQKALEFHQQALATLKELGVSATPAQSARLRVGTTLSNIGGAYQGLGQYANALKFYQQALAIFREVGNRARVGITLGKLGEFYGLLGQYSKALDFLQQALATSREVGDRYGEAVALRTMGEVYTHLEQYPQALDFLQQALAISRKAGDRSQEEAIFLSMGIVYKNLGQYPQALQLYQQVLKSTRELGQRRTEGATLHEIGTVYKNLGQYSKALEFYQQVLIITREEEDPPAAGLTLTSIGSTLLQTGDAAAAEKNLLAAIKIWESLRPGLTDVYKVSIFETQAVTYRYLQEALIAQNKTDVALEIAERGRARAFVELLARRLSPNQTKQPIITLPALEQIKQIAKTEKATQVEYSIADTELFIWVIQPTGEVAFRRSSLKTLDANLAEAAERTRVAAATGRSRGAEQQDTPIANLVRGSRESINVASREIGLNSPPSELARNRGSRGFSTNRRLQQLYQLLIQPIANLLPANPEAKVIFIPHTSLLLVPFPALQDASGKYLIEEHTIQTAPAIQVLDFTHKARQQVTGKDAVVVGNPTIEMNLQQQYNLQQLDGAEQEAIDIAKLLNTNPLLRDRPTKADIIKQLPQARIIHLATHGLLEDFKKLGVPGGIILAPDGNKDNGLLTADEILDLKFNAELVVVSACNTGRGRITGDGVIGLSRSLLSAGASSVIVSLWLVPDAPTAELMKEFYRNLALSKDKAVALRQAMLKTMEKHPNPRDWAAFTLIGEAQ